MPRLIDADALNEILKGSFQTENIRSGDNDGYFFQKGWNDAIRSILTSLEKMPTIEDSEPVRHGRWIKRGQDIFCSECDEESGYTWAGASRYSDYCPNCGSKLHGGADDVSD